MTKYLRPAGIILCSLVIFGCGLYSYDYGRRHFYSLSDYLENPEAMAGRTIVLTNYKVMAAGGGYFNVKEEDTEIRVEGDIPGIKKGDMVCIEGIFNKEGYISLRDYYIVPYRKVKIIVSCLGLIFAFLYLLTQFRFNPQNFTFIERHNA